MDFNIVKLAWCDLNPPGGDYAFSHINRPLYVVLWKPHFILPAQSYVSYECVNHVIDQSIAPSSSHSQNPIYRKIGIFENLQFCLPKVRFHCWFRTSHRWPDDRIMVQQWACIFEAEDRFQNLIELRTGSGDVVWWQIWCRKQSHFTAKDYAQCPALNTVSSL